MTLTTVAAMRQDIAERCAATACKGISLAQAQLITREYLAQPAKCPVCANTGTGCINGPASVGP
jgi:hypothetical protein